jgi:hypothetical protein
MPHMDYDDGASCGGSGSSGASVCGLDHDKTLTTALLGARPTTAVQGVATAPWLDGAGCTPKNAELFLEGTLACVVDGPDAHGVELYGYDATLAKWVWIPFLHNRESIPIFAPGIAWQQLVVAIGVYSRLAVVGIPTAGVVTAKFVPVKD